MSDVQKQIASELSPKLRYTKKVLKKYVLKTTNNETSDIVTRDICHCHSVSIANKHYLNCRQTIKIIYLLDRPIKIANPKSNSLIEHEKTSIFTIENLK